jgi:hypothetical protein
MNFKMTIRFKGCNLCIVMLLLSLTGCVRKNNVPVDSPTMSQNKNVYEDIPYLQDYSIKYYLSPEQGSLRLKNILADRDGHIRILTEKGVLVPDKGSFFYPGKLVPDISYAPTAARKISAIGTYRFQTMYLDSQYLFSNAWAGKIQVNHGLPAASLFAAGANFDFLISDGKQLVHKDKESISLWSAPVAGIKQISYLEKHNSFLLVFTDRVTELTARNEVKELYHGSDIRCASEYKNGEDIWSGNKRPLGNRASRKKRTVELYICYDRS